MVNSHRRSSLSTIRYLLSTVSQTPIQILSHYPAQPPPVRVRLWESSPHECVYLPGRMSRTRAFLADSIPPEIYHDFMDANFRRSGKVVYQPACAGCRACRSIRIPVDRFKMNKSQRRCWRRNQDLSATFARPQLTDEKFELYARYQRDWHGKADTARDELAAFLYESPVNTLEFEYRDPAGRLLAVGICDVCSRSLSSVYFYFDPEESARSLGTYGVLREIEEATKLAIPFVYLGYWVRDCQAMEYKSAFKPCEILSGDGVWRQYGENPSTESNA